ncbi:uncharacterized protein [Macrobrachium rosenbergii]|uniref:uncharacterized protein n=1 Tax=Macrobrachium rosenbergii TaxID=79674 RepID=UPI0034D5AD45
MNCGKAPGKDGIPAEVFKSLGTLALGAFHDGFSTIWETEDMSADSRDAILVALYKTKGSKSDCGNCGGISLLFIIGNILAHIHRLIGILESTLPKAKCGFRPGRSTINMFFVVCQIQEKCIEQQMDLYVVFIDLTKVFNTVNRDALWSILTKLGCSPEFITLIQLLHENMTGQVLSNSDVTNTFQITNGVKKGSTLVAVLFNLFFTGPTAYGEGPQPGCAHHIPVNGSVFDLHHLSAKRMAHEKLILKAHFADDCALMAHKENHLLTIVDRFTEVSFLFRLTVSLGKMKVLVQATPNTTRPQPAITFNDNTLKCVVTFRYLGNTISADGSLDKETTFRIQKASQVLERLRVKVLQQKGIK